MAYFGGMRRLTATGSGEIITRLGSGHLPQPRVSLTGETKLPTVPEASRRTSETGSRRQSGTNVNINGPREPKDGTKAEPGPSSARNVGEKDSTAPSSERIDLCSLRMGMSVLMWKVAWYKWLSVIGSSI